MTIQKRNYFSTLLFLFAMGILVSACGVKGPPLPPLGKQDIIARPSSLPSKGP
jgi:predicted small lipoprotein YifL